SSSLELAFRAIAWIWAINLFAKSASMPASFLKRMIKSLIAHGQHVETHLSTYFSPNTHLTGEALGLFYIGIAFPEFRSAERWKKKGLGILIEEMPRQIRGDGVYFEESSYYHRYAVDFYLSLFQTARENDIALPPEVEARLAAMINYLVWITRPDGTPTLVGDDDGGRLLTLGARSAYDFRDSIAWATALFGRSCWKHSADQKNPELLWLLGPSGIEQFDRLPTKTPDKHSRAFEATGQFVMRSGWEPRSEYFFFRCGPRGRLSGAHDHADQ